MKIYYTLLLLILTVFSCKNEVDTLEENYAYLGGKIINPNTDYVILSKSDATIDTLFLDANDRFMHKVENLEAGLYKFYHGGEFQLVLLEPRDSILFRLNTLDFDESLVYTGDGAKKNNYLINDFLMNEKEKKTIYKLSQLDADVYEKKVDSIKNRKLDKLANFETKYATTGLFNKIAKANIDYSYYYSKEIYPFYHYGQSKKEILNTLPKGFYDYRKDINYNDAFLKDYFYYNSYLIWNFNNLALQRHFDHSNSSRFNKLSLCFNLDKFKMIDSLVTNKDIKNNLLYDYTMSYLARSRNNENNTAILNAYLSKSTNEESKAMVKRFTRAINNLKEGSRFPEIFVNDYNGNKHDVNALIDRPTVISFWTHSYFDHFKESHYKIKELRLKYPEVKFININIDGYDVTTSKQSLQSNRFSIKDEYQFVNPKESIELLAIQPMNKSIIIDKNKIIVNNNTNIFSHSFEKQLLGLINR
ncbi:hypothetical protein [Changchengzhania lutea]|uniref:hypothetical protein n=1 Tax=Changchengzhania lutea TaxID=2049305 RepID=UPI00115E97CD|nr:hypothetical protein [Changchengzhania lutea]